MSLDPTTSGNPARFDLAYRVDWISRSLRGGAHRSRHTGGPGTLRDVVPFLRSPDPRRIELRQSIRDPWETLYTRRFEQPSAIDVVLLGDVSGSMGFRGVSDKLKHLAALAEVLAHSARRIGDRFSFIACDSTIRSELCVAATKRKGGEPEMSKRIASFRPLERDASGLLEAGQNLAGRRKFVVLVSDFRIASQQLICVLEALAEHDVLPIVLNDAAEVEALPNWGFAELGDLEDGTTRLLFLRPALKQQIVAREQERMSGLKSLLSQYTREPLICTDVIDWQRLAAALMGAAP